MYAIVRYLESERDLSAEELRLTLSIEDPMIAERREQVGCGARSAGRHTESEAVGVSAAFGGAGFV